MESQSNKVGALRYADVCAQCAAGIVFGWRGLASVREERDGEGTGANVLLGR